MITRRLKWLQTKLELLRHINRNKNVSPRLLNLVTADKFSEHEFIRMALEDFASTCLS